MIKVKKAYIKKFKEEPMIIGLFWNDREELKKRLQKSIDNNTPYNEYEELTADEKKSYDKGKLLF